jgi:glycosyltransferase involved in cell wall biosynthesis
MVKISVVMPYYNVRHEWFLLALQSVRNQAKNNPSIHFDIWIIDDKSPLLLPDLDSFFSQKEDNLSYRVLFNEKNLGVSYARNRALKEIDDSSYVLFLDGDDILYSIPKDFELWDVTIGQHFVFSEEKDVVFVKDFSENNTKSSVVIVSAREFFLRTLLRSITPVSCYLMKKSVIKDIFFPENIRSCEDWCFWVRMFYHLQSPGDWKIRKTRDIFCSIRKTSGSVSASIVTNYEDRKKFYQDLPRYHLFSHLISKTNILLCDLILENHINLPKQALLLWESLKLFVVGIFWERAFYRELLFHLTFCILTALHPKFILHQMDKRYKRRASQGLTLNKF